MFQNLSPLDWGSNRSHIAEMHNMVWIFHWRWMLWAQAGFFLLAYLGGWKQLNVWMKKKRDSKKMIQWICFIFFVVAFLGKISQWFCLQLHGQDFWLFVDLLEQSKKGGFFLTRFAPHATGWVQHGSVHAFFSFNLWLPVAWILGPVPAALLFNPVMLAGAAYVFGKILLDTLPVERQKTAPLWVWAFLASTQLGKVLMYEVHPESMYPLAFFLWVYAYHKKSGWGLLLASLLGAGIQEGSVLVFGPLILVLLTQRKFPRKYLLASLAVCIGVWSLQFASLSYFRSGQWGPLHWPILENIFPVFQTARVGSMKDLNLFGIFSHLLESNGGVSSAFIKCLGFFVSRPWLALWVLTPWVVSNPLFWVSILPLAALHAWMEGPNHLWNYYSAPFLGFFWWFAIRSTGKSWGLKYRGLWVFLISAFLGSNSVDIYFPREPLLRLRQQVADLMPQILATSTPGIVADPFLGLVPLEKVYSEKDTLGYWKLEFSKDQKFIPIFVPI